MDINVGVGPHISPLERAELAQERWAGVLDAEHDKKRRRYDTIERKMALLQLHHQNAGQIEGMIECTPPINNVHPFVSAPPLYQTFSASSTSSTDSASLGYPYVSHSPLLTSGSVLFDQCAVEEPPSPQFGKPIPLPPHVAPLIQEVRMKGPEPAWYEREKDRRLQPFLCQLREFSPHAFYIHTGIVITDLDEVVAELEAEEEAAKKKTALNEDEYKSEAEPHPDFAEFADSNADFSISNALLDHLFRVSPQQPKANQGALILYRPPPITSLPPGYGREIERLDDVVSDRTGGGEGAIGYGGYGDEYDMSVGNGVNNTVVTGRRCDGRGAMNLQFPWSSSSPGHSNTSMFLLSDRCTHCATKILIIF